MSKTNGQFKKGRTPWNKGTKGIMKANTGSFKPGQRAGNKNNTWKGGIQTHKDCKYVYIRVGKRQIRARYNWEKINGRIPTGMVLYHIDENKYNDNIDNLKLITRAQLLNINTNR